jgi:tetratricopeptide (TPR) repeat protein
MRYKDTQKSLSEIARELNVDAVLEGAVLQSGQRIRITAQLIDATTERHLWNESSERDGRDVLALQSEVARAVAREIGVTVTPEEARWLATTRPVDPEAHRLNLWGRHYAKKMTNDGYANAIAYFERAIQKAPAYAPAYAGLAFAYIQLGSELPTPDAMSKARRAALKALQLDDRLAEAHALMADILMTGDWDWTGAEQAYRRAIELNPGFAGAHHRYSIYLGNMGRVDEALAEAKRAVELDPLSIFGNNNLARVYNWARRFDDALNQSRTVLELAPTYGNAFRVRGQALVGKGLYREAISDYEKFSASPQGDTTYALAVTGYARARAGDRRGALTLLQRMRAFAAHGYVPSYHFALIYIGLGDTDRAFAWLEKTVNAREASCLALKIDPLLDSLRSDPRYTNLLRRVGLP